KFKFIVVSHTKEAVLGHWSLPKNIIFSGYNG
ncbi:jg24599, partial [Pararge aegeria aegeria]